MIDSVSPLVSQSIGRSDIFNYISRVSDHLAIGCPDPVISNAYWFRRMDGDLLIGCKHSEDRWRLSCSHDNQWIGESVDNCTAARKNII